MEYNEINVDCGFAWILFYVFLAVLQKKRYSIKNRVREKFQILNRKGEAAEVIGTNRFCG